MNPPPRGAPRGPRLAAALAAPLLAALVCAARIAAAGDAGEPIRLDYRAGAGCPDETAFVARIGARMARARLVGEGEQARTFTVVLSAGAHPSGSVTVIDGARSEGTRSLDADTCDQVADALALMVALALDPPAPRAASAPSASAPLPLAASAPPATPPPPPSSQPPPLPSPPPTPAEETPARAHHFFAGADVAAATGVTPSALFAGAPYVGWRATSDSLVAPSVRASFLRAGTGAFDVTGGTATFTWTVGRVDACGMLWPRRALQLGACARAEAGVLDVSGRAPGGAETEHTPWVAAGLLARLEWSFLGPLLLDLDAGPSFHITADHFFFRPEASGTTNGYEVSVVGFFAAAGLGVHFL